MSTIIEDKTLSITIDSNPKTFKPILYTTYGSMIKYILHIVYEDESSKDIELDPNNTNKLYKITFKRDGKLITVTGVIRNIFQISECNKMCDFANKIIDSEDLLIEVDCSDQYKCNKVRFYLKDIRDIVEVSNTDNEDKELPYTTYPIYLNGYTCDKVIQCEVFKENEVYKINLSSKITKLGVPLNRDQYSDFDIFVLDFDPEITIVESEDDETNNNVLLTIPEELLNNKFTLILRYFVTEINHAVFDEFTILPIINEENDSEQEIILTRAVTTQDTQYLGDGIKPALGVGMTPGYKEYRNKKSYNESVLEK